MIKDFKEFVLRGNVVDLAVGVVIGAAFGTIVTSMVTEVFNPLIALLRIPDFREAAIQLGAPGEAGDLRYGIVLNSAIGFIITAAFVFFLVIRPLNRLMGRDRNERPPEMRECPYCLTSIKKDATVCASCTRDVPPLAPSAG